MTTCFNIPSYGEKVQTAVVSLTLHGSLELDSLFQLGHQQIQVVGIFYHLMSIMTNMIVAHLLFYHVFGKRTIFNAFLDQPKEELFLTLVGMRLVFS